MTPCMTRQASIDRKRIDWALERDIRAHDELAASVVEYPRLRGDHAEVEDWIG